jgi:hypothetical protein
MNCKYSAKDIETGNVPAFVGTKEFTQIYPIGRGKLLEYCSMEGAPIIKSMRKITIKTMAMIEFIEKQSKA